MQIQFTVLGEPQGKGRPKTVRLKTGQSHTYTPDKTVVYENLIVTEFRRQCGAARFPDREELDMHITAYYTIPASASHKKQRMMESGEIRPIKKPDMDNVLKVVADALNAVAYRDDTQVVGCQLRKYYSRQPRIEVLILTAQK